jgi:hypothetical protein
MLDTLSQNVGHSRRPTIEVNMSSLNGEALVQI